MPPERRGEAFSTFFAILYVMLAVPAVGVGALVPLCGLSTAGTVFAVLVALPPSAVLAGRVRSLVRSRTAGRAGSS
ncbi:hypothetical protein STSP_36380 [Streptomyces jeddahensis]|uniref:Uncharacterized protein n=2 Tax=Streptomyces jeddahensis TaxID=1716141 RepID=A0A177HPR6_9ACTN|nr:hypothetical protein STSP_36380 [Streptomyces jeddahensis]